MNKQKQIKKILKKLSSNWVIISGFVAGALAAISALFRGGSYLYYKGRYDFWNVPVYYIEVDYANTLFNFLLSAFIMMIFICISNLYCYLFWKFGKKKSIWKQILRKLILVMLLCAIVAAFFIIYLFYKGFAIELIKDYIKIYTWDFFKNVLKVSFVLFITMNGTGMLYVPMFSYKEKQENSDKRDKKEKERNNKKRKKMSKKNQKLLGIILIILGIFWGASGIYESGRHSAEFEKKISIVTLNEDNYLIVGQYGDNWILKKCKYENEEIVEIEYDNYLIEDIQGKSILLYDLKENENVSDYFQSKEDEIQ